MHPLQDVLSWTCLFGKELFLTVLCKQLHLEACPQEMTIDGPASMSIWPNPCFCRSHLRLAQVTDLSIQHNLFGGLILPWRHGARARRYCYCFLGIVQVVEMSNHARERLCWH